MTVTAINTLDAGPDMPGPRRHRSPVIVRCLGGETWWWREPPRVAILLLIGALLGPSGVTVIQGSVLSLLEAAVPVALAAVGILVAATIRVDTTQAPALTKRFVPWLAGIVATLAVAGGVAWYLIAPPTLDAAATAVALRLLQGWGAAALIALAGFLLLTRSSSETERRVFALALVLLLGGAAEALSQPALILGCIAGGAWRLVGGDVLDYTRRDIGYLLHPSLALLLVVAGARVQLATPVLLFAAATAVLTLTIERRFGYRTVPFTLGAVVLALDLVRIMGSPAGPLAATMVLATIGAQFADTFRDEAPE